MVRQNKGFTLIELLAVIAIIAIMALVLVPSISGLQSAGGFTKAISDISMTLTQARLYAMAHNTYVFVGITETQEGTPSSATQTVATSSNGGRVWLDVVASQDGTPGYDTGLTQWNLIPAGYPGAGQLDLTPIQKPEYFDNTHIAELENSGNIDGSMNRPVVANADQVGDSSFDSTLNPGMELALPLGSPSPRVTFTKIIQFDPQGVPSVLGVGIVPSIEIGLQPTHGGNIPPLPTSATLGNQAALQLDGTTGTVTVYRS
jgi:prepilin-type N-terminal cleavage/methylation domain-containing protein